MMRRIFGRRGASAAVTVWGTTPDAELNRKMSNMLTSEQ
jgi:hypothetical protein